MTQSFTVHAPGRVNLIGEHVDYNDGFVLPMALPLKAVFRLRPRDDDRVILRAVNFGETREFSLSGIEKQGAWIDYVQGVARELLEAGVKLKGFEGEVESGVPVASGLSSSAAMEVGATLGFLHVAGQEMSEREVALLSQRAENKFIGVNSGIMDQMAVAACRKDHALLLDCRSLETEQVPFHAPDLAVVIVDSGAPRELASSAYNERRQECEEALRLLQGPMPQIRSLRDVSPDELAHHADRLPRKVAARAHHVVSEIARTQEAVEAMRHSDWKRFGRLMRASHLSLSNLYEVSSRELDWLTNWASQQPGVLGSRMTGAGFGGCTVTLIARGKAEDFIARLPDEYRAAMQRDARCWICEASDGARVEV